MSNYGIVPFTDGPSGDQPSGGGDGSGLIGALIGAGTAIYTANVAKQNTNKTIAANKAQSEYAYSKDLEMWNRQNDYNSPEAQMARLKAAGLNPNMIYGSGANTGNASTLPKYNAPTLQYNYQPIDIPSVLGAYQNFRIQQAQLDNVRAQTENIRSRTISEASRNSLLAIQGKRATEDLRQVEYTNPYQAAITGNKARASEAQLAQEWQKVKLMSQQEILNNLQKSLQSGNLTTQQLAQEKARTEILFNQYRNQWMKQGITSSDSLPLRMIVRMMSQSGIDASERISNAIRKFHR